MISLLYSQYKYISILFTALFLGNPSISYGFKAESQHIDAKQDMLEVDAF